MSTAIERCKLHIKLIGASNLTITDKLTKSTDGYVKIPKVNGLLCNDMKSEVIPKSLNPQWNEDFNTEFTYKLDTIKFKVMDKDKLGDNDKIGAAFLPVSPFLLDGQEHEFKLPILVEKKDGARRYRGELTIKAQAEWKFPILFPNTWLQCNERKIVAGLGWDVSKKKNVDLDASVAAFDATNKLLGKVSFNELKALNGALVHSGDNRTGEGEGDDERITIDFALMPPEVEKLAVVVNSYSGQSFMEIKSAYFRVSSLTQGTQGFYRLSDMANTTGMFMGAFLLNRANGLWYFQAVGRPVGGKVLLNSIPNIVAIMSGFAI